MCLLIDSTQPRCEAGFADSTLTHSDIIHFILPCEPHVYAQKGVQTHPLIPDCISKQNTERRVFIGRC